MSEIVGWIGSILFSLCAAPQAYKSWKQKHSRGLDWSFLLMWLLGGIFTIAYVSQKEDVLPLLVNYYTNLSLLCVIIWYRLFPAESKSTELVLPERRS